jgi:hypothetical protein
VAKVLNLSCKCLCTDNKLKSNYTQARDNDLTLDPNSFLVTKTIEFDANFETTSTGKRQNINKQAKIIP